MFHNLIWDFDGTLFDTYPSIANSLRAAVEDLADPPGFEEVMDMALISIDGCLTTMSATYDLPLEELEPDSSGTIETSPPTTSPPSTAYVRCASSSATEAGSISLSPIADAREWTACWLRTDWPA